MPLFVQMQISLNHMLKKGMRITGDPTEFFGILGKQMGCSVYDIAEDFREDDRSHTHFVALPCLPN